MFFLTCMCITTHSSHYFTDFFFGRKTSLRHEKFLPTNDFLTKLSAVYLRNAPCYTRIRSGPLLRCITTKGILFCFTILPFLRQKYVATAQNIHPPVWAWISPVCVCMCTVCAPQSKVQVFLGVVQFHTWYVRGKSNYDIGSISFLSGTLLKFLFLIRELGVH